VSKVVREEVDGSPGIITHATAVSATKHTRLSSVVGTGLSSLTMGWFISGHLTLAFDHRPAYTS